MIDEPTVAGMARALGLAPSRLPELTEAVEEQLASQAKLWETDVEGFAPLTDPSSVEGAGADD